MKISLKLQKTNYPKKDIKFLKLQQILFLTLKNKILMIDS